MRVKTKILSLSIVIIIALTMIMPCTVAYGASFPDLESSNFAYDAIMQLTHHGVINGYDDGKFYPNNSLKRSEYCKLVTTAMEIDIDSYADEDSPFSDIKDSYWGRNYISACYDVKLIDGMGDGTFCPENTITYEQAVKIAVCAAGLEEEVNENPDSKWYSGYIETASENGLLNNTSGVLEKPISRACASQIIYNTFFEYEGSKEPEPTETPLPTVAPTITPTIVPTVAPTIEPAVTEEPVEEDAGFSPIENLIFIDPGHNYEGMDTGASDGDLKEEELTWEIADKLRAALERNGFEVIMSRDNMTSSIANTSVNDSLMARCEMANSAYAEMFISIHCNSGGGTGVETYCYSKTSVGYNLANMVQDNIVESTGMVNRKVKTANYVVIRETLMPAILIETGFIDHEEDAAIISSEEGQTLIAEGIAKGICEYKDVPYIEAD